MNNIGLLGWPVKHSVSPQMQNAGFEASKLDFSYSLVEAEPEKLGEIFKGHINDSFTGFNVTVPHKENIIPFIDQLDETAKTLGSVNTIVKQADGTTKGYSTDGYGMSMSLLESFGYHTQGGKFLFIGAGGAARAVALYFALNGAADISIINRTVSKAEKICDEIKNISNCETSAISNEDYDAMDEAFQNADVIIQSSSLGLKEDDPLPISPSFLQARHKVVDMIYHETLFMKTAKDFGCDVADGRGMLLHQGAKAWEIWTGQVAPVETMRIALNKALDK